mmetsp:Transcript_13083/g.30954  ORF Transcript_13083/g.30954 Transcript_13083/m.30954 type:complete len:206 (-) Transcript_13083:161-778(-)
MPPSGRIETLRCTVAGDDARLAAVELGLGHQAVDDHHVAHVARGRLVRRRRVRLRIVPLRLGRLGLVVVDVSGRACDAHLPPLGQRHLMLRQLHGRHLGRGRGDIRRVRGPGDRDVDDGAVLELHPAASLLKQRPVDEEARVALHLLGRLVRLLRAARALVDDQRLLVGKREEEGEHRRHHLAADADRGVDELELGRVLPAAAGE